MMHISERTGEQNRTKKNTRKQEHWISNEMEHNIQQLNNQLHEFIFIRSSIEQNSNAENDRLNS